MNNDNINNIVYTPQKLKYNYEPQKENGENNQCDGRKQD